MKLKVLIIFIITSIRISIGQSNEDIPNDLDNADPETLSTFANEELAADLLLEYEFIRTRKFSTGEKIIKQADIDSMSSIANQINQAAPNSFSAAYVQFRELGFTEEGFLYLSKAESLTPNKTELYTDFLAAAHILEKPAVFQEYSSKLRTSGFISPSVLEYNKNILRSIPETNAFIITNGWDDTYPLLTLLEDEKKTNTTVINVEWIHYEHYRAFISKKLNTTNSEYNNNPYGWINNICSLSDQNIYFTPTLPSSKLLELSDKIIPIGILFKMSSMTKEEQVVESIKAWKKFSKVNITSSHPISKNYIILLTFLERSLKNETKESGTLIQIQEFKTSLEEKHPSLK